MTIDLLPFPATVDTDTGCWIPARQPNDKGYVHVTFDGRQRLAHRVAYEMLVGPIPEGLCIDHLCRVRNCVNPNHLEPVTVGENNRRGEHPAFVTVRTGVCHRGHSMEDAYVRASGEKRCRTCSNAVCREYRARRKAAS